jgi:hypothetical protein
VAAETGTFLILIFERKIMELEEAKKILDGCVRQENRDHAFGDKEVYWEKDGVVMAEGYFGNGTASVWMDPVNCSFENADARSLMNCGTLGTVGRNDETGPDEYVEGQIMPGLTLEGVRKELEG